MAREYFCAYHTLEESLKPFSDAERGRILSAALAYSARGELVELVGNEKFIWPTVKMLIDRDKDAYEQKCKVNRENGRKSLDAAKTRQTPNAPQDKDKDKDEDEDKDKDKDKTPSSVNKPQKVCVHPHGTYGWVKLSDEQYSRLLKDLGQTELDRCIAYIDEQAQKSGNRNKWKDWNLVVRACSRDGWGLKGGAPTSSSCSSSVNIQAVHDLLAENRKKQSGELFPAL